MAVDRVQSEPLSGEIQLTADKTEKISAFPLRWWHGDSLSHWIETYGSLVPIRSRS
jgi:hypothetical protein